MTNIPNAKENAAIDSCSVNTGDLLSAEQALAQIKARLPKISGRETVTLRHAVGRVLAMAVQSAIAIPSDRNSAMDGFAFSSRDAQSTAFSLRCVGTSWAGQPYLSELQSGDCVQIFTGAVVPEGADSVVMQERVTVSAQQVTFPAACAVLQNIREIGESVQPGDTLLPAGKGLTAADIGLLAAAGIDRVAVTRKITVGFFSTGNELVSLNQSLKTGQLYDSNRYTLDALLNDPCFVGHDLGVIADEADVLEQRLKTAASQFDVLMTTGGASVGAADYVAQVVRRCGQINFWKIAIKPGKPLLFGQLGDCVFFGLPGNPVAVGVTFDQFVKPALRHLCGDKNKKPLQIKVLCLSDLKKTPGRQEYQRGILQQNAQGELTVQSVGKQGSHLLDGLSRANCYIILDSECAGVEKGTQVKVEPFSTWI